VRDFEILFDTGEKGIDDPATRPYGSLGFPAPPSADRPWIYSNFVQTLDGIVSLRGEFGAGRHISESAEDRWLMDLLRAHADAVIYGINTLVEERAYIKGQQRGPVFRVVDPELQKLRERLGRAKMKNIFVTASATINLADYRVFDGELVDAYVVSTNTGAAKLRSQRHPSVNIIEAGEWPRVDLEVMVRKLRAELGIQYLLCEGGPRLYGSMARAGLIDEKFVTISPVEVGQAAPPEQVMTGFDLTRLRPTTFAGPGFTRETMPWWTWISCRKVGDHEFNRYRRKQVSRSEA
jgi:riboflavin biosynthesis pyrimidine reductase